MELLKPDLCIIGAGAGGLDVAAAAALAGKAVVLVAKGKIGGGRLHGGAVPSKALVAASRQMHRSAQAAAFGVSAVPPVADFHKLAAHIDGVVAALTPDSTKERFTGLGVRVIEGAAQFKNRRRLMVGETIEIRARRTVIATGSAPALPDIAGLAEAPALTSETILGLGKCPQHLIVIGAEAAGLEFAQAFRRLGASVTVLADAAPLSAEDPECARIVLDALVRDGVVMRAGVAIARVAKTQDGVQVVIGGAGGEETIDGSHLLVTSARQPNLDGLALDKAKVKCGPQGILVNATLRTSNRRIYAIGDVTGALPFAHVARYQAGLVVQNALFGTSAAVDLDGVPRVTFTDPELAHVGITDAEAARRRLPCRVLRWPFRENDRAQIEREVEGHIKVVTDPKGKVLGATIVGAQAGELIATWSLAVAQGLDIQAIAGIVLPYPTLADVGKRVAMTYFTVGSTRSWVRRMIGLLRRSH